MNRYKITFEKLRQKKQGAFIPFVVLGDPDFETSKKILEKMVKHADCIELGFPFSDPIADGKRIQAADERAINAGINPDKCFELIKHVRSINKEIPIGLLIYYNIVFTSGINNFLAKTKKAGVDAILVADMPLEESSEFNSKCISSGIEQVFIAAPTTGKERLAKIISKSTAFVYVVGVLGVTGERKNVDSSAGRIVSSIKNISKIPACVGFGISKPEHVKKIIGEGADGAIVGSAVEAIIEENLCNKKIMLEKLDAFFKAIKNATC